MRDSICIEGIIAAFWGARDSICIEGQWGG
jgi:hypothetical protein